MCTPPAQPQTEMAAGPIGCRTELQKVATFLYKTMNYLMFFRNGDFVIIS
jgi:hypothetical protein